MLLYAVADIHSNEHYMGVIEKTVERAAPDVLVAAGDLSGHFGADPGPVVKRLSALNIPVLAVCGNTDGKKVRELLRRSENVMDLHLKQIQMNGVSFSGVGGTLPVPFRSRLAVREKPLLQQLENLTAPGGVFVAHPPPHGVRDGVFGRFSAGSKAVASIIGKRRPALCVCGHIHENSGAAALGETLVVNCAMNQKHGGALVEMEPGRVISCEMAPMD